MVRSKILKARQSLAKQTLVDTSGFSAENDVKSDAQSSTGTFESGGAVTHCSLRRSGLRFG